MAFVGEGREGKWDERSVVKERGVVEADAQGKGERRGYRE